MSPVSVTFDMSPVTCHLSCVTSHLTTNLCSFTCYESLMRFGDAAAGGFVINIVLKKHIVCPPPK